MNKKVLALLGFGHAITDIIQGGLTMMLAFLQPVLTLSQLQVGMVMLAFNLSSSVIQPAFGIFSDRFRAAWLIPTGCLLAGVGMSLTGFMPNYTLLLVASLIAGLGVAAYHPEGSKYARCASGSRKASGMAIFSVGGNFGFAMGPILATLLLAWAGREGTLGFLVINGVMSLLLWFYLPTITKTEITGPLPPPKIVRESPTSEGRGLSQGQIIGAVIMLVLVIIMRTWMHFGIVTFLPQYSMHHLQHSQGYAAGMTSIFLLFGAFGTVFGGPAADRWGLKTVIVASMAVTIPLLYLFPYTSGPASMVVIALSGFALISTFAITVVLGQELLPNNVGLASGLTLGFGIGAGGIGATLLGWFADRWGLPSIFHIMIIFAVTGLVLSFFLPGREKLLATRTDSSQSRC
ncbi:MAG: MFS transporter [Desulfobulbus oligotrophicus]|jgi:FSR family fosmidomycin resistance protein-like MFS transporter|nr:MFS transporter [Desulfobulbus oligotrophicus]